MNACSVCGKIIEREDAPVLTISGYGNVRYLCDECAHQMDVAMGSRDTEEIEATIKELGDKMNAGKDEYAVAAMYNFISVACERLSKIKEDTYDFSIDEKMQELDSESSFDEIPEELQETEEDRELDKIEAEKQKKFDEIMNWVSLIAIVGTAIFVIISYFV
jgi:hypothetical protein